MSAPITWDNNDLQDQMLELTDDCPSVQDCIHRPEIRSLNVLGGSWILYELPNFRERFLDWGAVNAKVSCGWWIYTKRWCFK
uniref:Beta/gamma crystallin 'Greek key' domain-containing protein n=1 Tax=Chelonoidis abingdonii TaxID=106734 RepID=A0A8C0QRA7_CHEAB